MVYTSEYASPLGSIALACDDNAIIGLWFSGQKYFGSTLPMHTEAKAHPLLQDARRWLDIYFSGKAPSFLPPLRYDSTPFRKAVCDIMLTIPYGRTMTYGQIARELARQAGAAQERLNKLDQGALDAIVAAMAAAFEPECAALAKMAVEEKSFALIH